MTTMPARTPTSILEARGSFINKPSRRRPNEPVVEKPIGSPPAYMTAEEKKVWKELAKQVPPGVLKYSDRLIFAVLVTLATKFQSRLPMMVMETNQMISISSKFGMTPADRSKLSIEKPPASGLSLFLTKKKA